MSDLIKQHEVNIYVNNNLVDIYSQDELNLRFNNILTDPTKIQTISGEYSFTFTLPITKINEKIFDYANVLSKRNKFNKKYNANVSLDGKLVFDGELIVVSVNPDGFKCNLYINKINTVDTIFGNSVMTDITDWKIDYNQDTTINEYNQGDIKYPRDCFFPLVSYGMFQKIAKDNQNNYTSKFDIDDYARIYNENFYPSLNLLKTVKKCFEHKGYNVDGDIFNDEGMKKIYMSTSVASDQDPVYNYGKPEMGYGSVTFNYSNYNKYTTSRGGIEYSFAPSLSQDLKNPKFYTGRDDNGTAFYLWTKNNVYDIWSADRTYLKEIQYVNDIMWRKNRFVAPASGFYKIRLKYDCDLQQNSFQTYSWKYENRRLQRYAYTPKSTFNDFFVELQLIKNSEDGLDSTMIIPDCIDEVYDGEGDTAIYNKDRMYNYSAYPHEAPGTYQLSTTENPYPGGYIPDINSILGYDSNVNKNFICGVGVGGPYKYNSVIKNGKSWNPQCADINKSRYIGSPYYGIKIVENTETSGRVSNGRRPRTKKIVEQTTNYGVNTLLNSTIRLNTSNDNHFDGQVECIVYLEKNDYIQLKMIQRQYDNKLDIDAQESDRPSRYRDTDFQTDSMINVWGQVSIEAFSPSNLNVDSDYFDWNNPSRFDEKLNLANFLNKEEKMTDFINNFIKEFNLSYSQSGKNITLSTQKIDNKKKNIIDLSDRVYQGNIESSIIEYPSRMSVEYNIDGDERGVYISAEKNATMEQMESNSWRDYADKGYDIVKMTDDENGQEQSVKTKTSYNWYENFNIKVNKQNSTYPLPIIAKDEWMIEGYAYQEMMKKSGVSLKRRYWFPSTLTDSYLFLNDNPTKRVKIKLCTNEIDNYQLSYKLNQKSLLNKYFNIYYDTDSNYIIFDTYLSADEYINIKDGSYIAIDNDIYIVIEVQGFDPSGNNKTKIKAIKA